MKQNTQRLKEARVPKAKQLTGRENAIAIDPAQSRWQCAGPHRGLGSTYLQELAAIAASVNSLEAARMQTKLSFLERCHALECITRCVLHHHSACCTGKRLVFHNTMHTPCFMLSPIGGVHRELAAACNEALLAGPNNSHYCHFCAFQGIGLV